MKLLRMGAPGQEVPCVIDPQGTTRDVSSIVADFGPRQFGDGLLNLLSGTDLTEFPAVNTDRQRIGSPMAQPRNIYCIGLNYSDHAAEAGMAIPDQPILFNKSSGAFCGPNDPTPYSPTMRKLDWEVELGIVIGTPALNVKKDDAMGHVFGYVLVNDISERVWQLDLGGQWSKGKSFPNFCPTGPWLVTADEIPDPQNLPMWLTVNGHQKQAGNTATMIFPVAEIVAYLSEFIQLEPGDLISTGTPPGVGMGQKPPQFLGIGDQVRLGIDGLGEQQQTVVDLNKFT